MTEHIDHLKNEGEWTLYSRYPAFIEIMNQNAYIKNADSNASSRKMMIKIQGLGLRSCTKYSQKVYDSAMSWELYKVNLKKK